MVETLAGGWHLRQIPAGVWLSRRTGRVPGAVRALAPEPSWVTAVIDAGGPGGQTDPAVGELFARLSAEGMSSVRLVLPWGADRYGRAASRAYGLDLVAAAGPVTITRHGYALVRSHGPPDLGDPPQWWRFLPSGETIPAGMLAPSPTWEQELSAGIPVRVAGGAAVHRVPAGLALNRPGSGTSPIAAAHGVWPDPERMIIVVGQPATDADRLLGALAELLLMLPGAAAPGVRLWWPRAGADPDSAALHETARRCGAELIAPSADVSVTTGNSGLCHGPGGAAPWVRFTGNPPAQPMGPLYPVPGWQRALDHANLAGLPDGLFAERVAAGLCVYHQDATGRESAQQGLAATARSLLPDPERPVVIAAGDTSDPGARHDLETVLGCLPARATRGMRIVLSGAGAGGQDSYAQALSDTLGSQVIAPTGAWTATPDGRLRAVAAGQPGAAEWQVFFPRGSSRRNRPPDATRPGEFQPAQSPQPGQESMPAPARTVPPAPAWETGAPIGPDPATLLAGEGARPLTEPADPNVPAGPAQPPPPPATGPPITTGTAAGPPPPTAEPHPPATGPPPPAPGPPPPAPGPPPPAPGPPPLAAGDIAPGIPGRIVPPQRDPRSLIEDRRLYRETSPEFHRHAVAVRRILSQRPGLRAAQPGAEEAVLIDFAALLDLLASYRSGRDSGERPEAWHEARMACAACGLRRLPSFRGPVYAPANLPQSGAGAYRSMQIVVEPSFIIATSSPAVSCNGHGDYVIWSETGKRIGALVERSRPDEVIFGPGTSFKVLRVDSAQPAPRIFLRELPTRHLASEGGAGVGGAGVGGAGPPGTAGPGDGWDTMDQRVLDQLGQTAAARDSTPPDRDAVPPWGNAAPAIGLDDQGVPFTTAALHGVSP
jgi:hypothetical protein